MGDAPLFLPAMPADDMFEEINGKQVMTMQWQEFFRSLYDRVGGSTPMPSVGELNDSILSPIEVADIDNPSELVGYKGTLPGTLIIITEKAAGSNEYTVYSWDDANASGVDSPYVVAGSSGFWTAWSGKYQNSDLYLPTSKAINLGLYDILFDGALGQFDSGAKGSRFNGEVAVAGDLDSEAGRNRNTTRVTADYTALTTDEVVLCNTDSVPFTLTLHPGNEGNHKKIINSGTSANDLIIIGDGAEKIWGYESIQIDDRSILNLDYNIIDGWW